MNLTQVLESARQSNPGMRRYYLVQERQRVELARIWIKAWAPHEAAKKQFLEELTSLISQTHDVRSSGESSAHFTISFKAPGEFYGGELVVVCRGPERDYPGVSVQVRRPGDTMLFRKMMLPLKATPAMIWARVSRYFEPCRKAAEGELAAAA